MTTNPSGWLLEIRNFITSMLSIVILNYNNVNLLKKCIKSILDAQIKIDYELIVVDNNSRDKSKEFLSQLNLSQIKMQVVLNNHNSGYAAGNNQAIKLAQGDYIFICNPDIIVLQGSIEKLYSYLKSHSDVGIVGPQLLNLDRTVQYSCCRFPHWYTPFLRRTFLGRLPLLKKKLEDYLMLDYSHKEEKDVDWMIGAALMFNKNVFEKLGGFDERYFLYFDDVDLARRIWKEDKRVVYLPNIQMIHAHQRLSAVHSTLPSLFSKILWIHAQSALKYFWKWR